MGQSSSTPTESEAPIIHQAEDVTETQNPPLNPANNNSQTSNVNIQSAIEAVAAQVYDNVHSQLASIQAQSVKQSETVVR
jgi:hypothetical protein